MIAKLFSDLKKNMVKIDLKFLVMVYTLLIFGLIMVFSASSPMSYAANEHDSFYYLKKQLIWAFFGTLGLLVTVSVDYRKYKKWAVIGYVFNLVLLLAVLVAGTDAKGAKRWLSLGGFTFQPTEVTKILMIIFYAYLLSETYKYIGKLRTLGVYALFLGIVAFLIMKQPHMSCTILVVASVGIMLFVAGLKWRHIIFCVSAGGIGAFFLAMSSDYRRARMLTFLNPFEDIRGDGWQIVQSLYAIGSGGIFGAGIGQSRQKYFNIPEPQNDFIFSIIAEELGLFGGILVVLMFVYLIYRGIKIALSAPDMFGKLLVSGIVGLIAIQAVINIAVVTSTMPVTGMALPFFSYGGTALAVTLAEMGIVLNVSAHGENK